MKVNFIFLLSISHVNLINRNPKNWKNVIAYCTVVQLYSSVDGLEREGMKVHNKTILNNLKGIK